MKTYPERLQVFHAGTGQTMMVGMTKLTAILFFGWGVVGIAPAVYFNPDNPLWMTPASTPSPRFSSPTGTPLPSVPVRPSPH